MLDHECLLLVPLPTDCGGAYSTTMGNYFSTYESAFVRSHNENSLAMKTHQEILPTGTTWL